MLLKQQKTQLLVSELLGRADDNFCAPIHVNKALSLGRECKRGLANKGDVDQLFP